MLVQNEIDEDLGEVGRTQEVNPGASARMHKAMIFCVLALSVFRMREVTEFNIL